MSKLFKGGNLKRTLFDPGGTLIHRVTTGKWDRGGGNARSALMPWASNEPVVPPPTVPLPDEEDLKQTKRRATSAQLRRGGRESTILTGGSDRLGP